MWCAFVAAFCMMSLLLWCNMTPSLAKVTEFLDESTLGLLFGEWKPLQAASSFILYAQNRSTTTDDSM